MSHHISSTNENLSVATDKFAYHAFVANMNKKRFTEFSNYLEGFTQRIVERFSDSKDFVNDEKTQMLGRFPELVSFQTSVSILMKVLVVVIKTLSHVIVY